MTFPTVAGIGTLVANAANPQSGNYPATVDANQLLLYFGGNDGTADTVTDISVATILLNPATNAQGHGAYAYEATAVGDEDGGTYTINLSDSEEIVAYVLAIDGWDGVTTPEISTVSNASSSTPNAPSITPSWGAEDTLFITVCTWNLDAGGVSAFPTNYDDNQTENQRALVNGSAFATREINGSPENAPAWALTNSVGNQAFTIAVRPASAGINTIIIVPTGPPLS
jgi:hypothetical protein